MPRLAVFALTVCALACAAAVLSFAKGSWLGVLWVMMAGISSNLAWFSLRKARRAGATSAAPEARPTADRETTTG